MPLLNIKREIANKDFLVLLNILNSSMPINAKFSFQPPQDIKLSLPARKLADGPRAETSAGAGVALALGVAVVGDDFVTASHDDDDGRSEDKNWLILLLLSILVTVTRVIQVAIPAGRQAKMNSMSAATLVLATALFMLDTACW